MRWWGGGCGVEGGGAGGGVGCVGVCHLGLITLHWVTFSGLLWVFWYLGDFNVTLHTAYDIIVASALEVSARGSFKPHRG